VPETVARKAKSPPNLPTADQLIDFIKNTPGKVGKREIARAFSIKGGDRIALKRLLKDLEADGKLQRTRRVITKSGELPSISALEIVGRDHDGELIAEPTEWDEDVSGPPPKVLIVAQPAKGTLAEAQPPAVGDRVLARLEPDQDPKTPYHGRIIRKLTSRCTRVLVIFRHAKGQG
jgi:ribonuclease R